MAEIPNPITPRALAFLRDLAQHNERPWFEANKARWLADVRDPLLRFVADFAPRLAKIDKRAVADPRPVGGSLFRIHRDTRFSKDKSPYKTRAALYFGFAAPRDVPAPGYYLQIEASGAMFGAGVWYPPTDAVRRVREAIVARPARWRAALKAAGLAQGDEERLARAPRGFDPEHPLVDDLRRKSFTLQRTWTRAEACAPKFPEAFARSCQGAKPLVDFLARALEL